MKGWKPEFKNSVFWERPIRSWGHISCFRYLFFREHLPSLIQINDGIVAFFFFSCSRHCLNICVVRESGMQTTSLSCLGTSAPSQGKPAEVCLALHICCLGWVGRLVCAKGFLSHVWNRLLLLNKWFFCANGFFLKLFLSSLWEKCVAFFTSGDCGSAL